MHICFQSCLLVWLAGLAGPARWSGWPGWSGWLAWLVWLAGLAGWPGWCGWLAWLAWLVQLAGLAGLSGWPGFWKPQKMLQIAPRGLPNMLPKWWLKSVKSVDCYCVFKGFWGQVRGRKIQICGTGPRAKNCSFWAGPGSKHCVFGARSAGDKLE